MLVVEEGISGGLGVSSLLFLWVLLDFGGSWVGG